MTYRENYLKAVRFEHPEHIPVNFSINESIYYAYEADDIAELLESHPIIAGKHVIRQDLLGRNREQKPYQKRFFDEFGVEWEEIQPGIRGTVIRHPLADFAKIRDYRFPDLPQLDVEAGRAAVQAARENGHLTCAGLPHGHTFLRLTDLCGYDTVLMGMADEDADLELLMYRLEEYNCAFTDYWGKLGYDMISFPEDLGMQVGPMISAAFLRREG